MEEAQYNSIIKRFDKLDEKVDKTNGKVRSLEIWRGIMMGVGIVLSILIIPIVLLMIEKNL